LRLLAGTAAEDVFFDEAVVVLALALVVGLDLVVPVID